MNRRAWLIAIVSILPVSATAQMQLQQTPPGQTTRAAVQKTQNVMTKTATIQSVDSTNRLVTLKWADGTTETLQVSPELKRFNELKAGQTLTARYYESTVYQLRSAGGGQATGAVKGAVTPGGGKTPGGTVAAQTMVTVTVTAVAPKVPSISVKTADGIVVTRRVQNAKILEGVKVGDQIDITYTEALLIDVQPAPGR